MKQILQLLLLIIPITEILSQEAAINDGPYVFQEDGQRVSRQVINGQPFIKTLSDNSIMNELQVATDQPGELFSVQLKPGLSYELSEYPMPKKLVALSDIEGNFGVFRKLLQATGVINKDLKWQFGKGHLVLTGDFFDRGAMVTEVLWLIYKLEEEARAKGGQVHFILGNHETMNLQGDLRYVHDKYKQSAKIIDKQLSDLYTETTELGQWLRTKNMVEKIGDVLFAHAGISQAVNEAYASVDEINAKARPVLDRDGGYPDDKTSLLMGSNGPLWYRGYYNKQPIPEVIDATLDKFNVKHIVTGHTVVADTISTWYDGKVINIDTRHAKGKSEALSIRRGKYYRIDIEGNRFSLLATEK